MNLFDLNTETANHDCMNPHPKFLIPVISILVALVSGGCQRSTPPAGPALRQLVVHHATVPIRVDGRLDKTAWQRAESVAFDVPGDPQQSGQTLEEKGIARLLWDDQFLYVAFEFTDSDVVALGTEDDQEHHALGDVAEIFLKPAEQTWYWEFHVTPAGYVSTYWYAGRGRWGLKGVDAHIKPRFIEAAAQVRGTLNDWRDRDQGWTAEVAIPLGKLDRFRERSNQKENWTILLARYNYTRYRNQATGPELSSWPVLSRPAYHLLEEYAQLKLVP